MHVAYKEDRADELPLPFECDRCGIDVDGGLESLLVVDMTEVDRSERRVTSTDVKMCGRCVRTLVGRDGFPRK